LAQELGVAPAPLAIAWCLRNPHVSTVLLGATRKEQLLQNLEALELAERFDESIWTRVEAATA
jgi:aryl-alcohol dehydrogenase-like predicted oxidoreductase